MHELISLKATLSDKLDWEEAILRAQKLVAEGKKIFWELKLGLETPLFLLEDELTFQGLSQAIRHFSTSVYERFEKDSLGVALYRGPLDLSSQFLWSESRKANYAAWQEEHPDEPLSEKQFCLDSYAAYFQMLSSNLSDDLPIYLFFDTSGLLRTEALLLLSKERFQHFELAASGLGSASWCLEWEKMTPSEATVGVSMPQECSLETLRSFEALLKELDEAGVCYRVLNEAFLTEQWDGLDTMIAPSITARGKRKLMGFFAAGGEIVYVGEPLGLPEELSWEEFRGRGIRTPDLLVPNQPR